MSLPTTEGFAIGSGFAGTFMTGCDYIDESGQSGGIQGGKSNPGAIKMRIAFKPIMPISRRENTVIRDKPIAGGDLAFCTLSEGVKQCTQCKGTGINSVDHFNGQFKASGLCWLCSWNGLGNMASTEAMCLFVKILEEEDPGWYSRVSNSVSEPVVDIELNFAGSIKNQYYNQSQFNEVRSQWSEFIYFYAGA